MGDPVTLTVLKWCEMLAFILAALAALAVFQNSLDGGFVIDDGSAIRTNADLRPETPVSALFWHDFWGRPIDAVTSVKSYRPLTVLTFRANFAMHGLDVKGYHIVNVVLHAACTVIVGVAARRIVRADRTAAAIAAFAFAVHPVHCEAVASMVGRAELLCCLFFFASLLCHEEARRPSQPLARSFVLFLSSCTLAVLATGSKETGITALAVAVALDALDALRPATPWRSRASCLVRSAAAVCLTLMLLVGSQRLRGRDLSPHFSFVDNPLPSLPDMASRLMSAAHVHVRYARLLLWPATLSADYSFNCVPAVKELRDGRNLAALALYGGLVWGGLAALRAQRGVSAASHAAHDDAAHDDAAHDDAAHDDASSKPAAEDATGGGKRRGGGGAVVGGEANGSSSAPAAEGAVVGGEAPVVPVRAVLGEPSVRAVLGEPSVRVSIGRALLLLVLPMLPASHLFIPIGTLVAERLLYTPSGGFCALVGLVASEALRAASRPPDRAQHNAWKVGAQYGALRLALALLLALLLGGAAVRTWERNRAWADSDSITRATASACPGSAKAQLSLGTMHLQHADYPAARRAFRRALSVHPEHSDAVYWLGRLAFMQGRLGQGEQLLLASLELNAGHPEANLFAALCAARRGADGAALGLLERAYWLAPHNAEIVRDYGAMLLRVGQPTRAVPVLRDAVEKLGQLHSLGTPTAHSRGALASAQVKLAAAWLLHASAHYNAPLPTGQARRRVAPPQRALQLHRRRAGRSCARAQPQRGRRARRAALRARA